jgi:acetyl-CoA C-acetyltransferase
VTAGNASGINDGAAAVVLMSEDMAYEKELETMATIRGYASCGVDPKSMGIGAAVAAEYALKRARMCIEDIDIFEMNEAFSAQSLAVIHRLHADVSKVNVNGGAIALGHPIGATGTRILVTLLHEMKKRTSRYGLATMCIGGGQGIAMVVER